MSAPRACSVEGCQREVRSKGLCQSHYMRQWRHGTPEGGGGARYSTAEDAFAARTQPTRDGSECILWTGSRAREGHGVIGGAGGTTLAYRYAWERVNGPVPDGMVLDHACRVPACVNVEHLRLATKAQNGSNRTGAQRGRKNHLPRGVYPSLSKYQVKIQHEGRQHYLGTYSSIGEAERVAAAARARFFGEFAGVGDIQEEDYE